MQKYRILIKKLSVTSLFLALFCYNASAQLQVGGNFGFDISNDILMIDIAPTIGTTPFTNARVSISPFFSHIQNIKKKGAGASRLGLRAAMEYTIFSGLFAHAEYELAFELANQKYQGVSHTLPLGAGFEYEVARNTIAYGMVLYDVLYNPSKSSAFRESPFQYRLGVRHTL